MQDYTVAVKLTLVNNISAGLLAVSGEFTKLNTVADAFHKKLTSIKSLMSTGASLMTGGFALAAPIIYAISKAAELQKQLVSIQIATHGTDSDMTTMRFAIEKASVPTQFSAITVSQIAKQVATSNSFTAPELTSLMPTIAKFADVQSLLKGTDPMSSATDAVKMMHLAQKYSPKDVEPYFDMITKVSLMMPGGVGELRSALSYFQPMGKAAMGIGDKDSLMMVALLSRLGLSGSRGGTNLLAAVTRTIPGIFGSGLLKGKSGEALNDMGFIDKSGHSIFMEGGKFDSNKFIMAMAATAKKFIEQDPKHGRERFMKDVQHAFGTQGGKVAGLFSSSQVADQLASMGQDFDQLANMGAIQDQFVKISVAQQFSSALTNVINAMTELGWTLLPLTTEALNKFNDEIKLLTSWMQAHPDDVKNFAKDFLYLAGLLTTGGAVYIAVGALTALTSPLGLLVVVATQWKTILNGYVLLFHALVAGFTYDMDKLKSYLTLTNATATAKDVGQALNNTSGLANTINPNTSGSTILFHHTTNVDGKTVANAVTKIQAKQGAQQSAHGSTFNGGIAMGQNMNNHIGQ